MPEQQKSFVDKVYGQINDVLGGDNINQFLCLTIPGQALTATDFSYDYKNNAPKGPIVEKNESNLANKLFDPVRMTGADNGLTLPYQYRTALDMLSPKLNQKLAIAKNEVRELLMTEYPYKFDSDDNDTHTLQEDFFHLYDIYVEEFRKWAELQTTEKRKSVERANAWAEQEIKRKGNKADEEAIRKKANTMAQDDYLTWYEDESDAYITSLDEKYSKILSVFSPNDMKILEGIIDAGSGAELEEARETLLHTRKRSPDGNYIYPVKFEPANWFELLDTSFTPIDLLKTPEALAQDILVLSNRRISFAEKISSITALIPSSTEIENAKKDVDKAKENLDSSKSALITKYGNGVSKVVDTVFDIASQFSDAVPVPYEVANGVAKNANVKEDKTPAEFIKELMNVTAEQGEAQQNYVNAAGKLADVSLAAVEKSNLQNLVSVLAPLKSELEKIDNEIKNLQMQMSLSSSSRENPSVKDADNKFEPKLDSKGEIIKVTDPDNSESSVAPPRVPEGYTQIIIKAAASTMDTASSYASNSSNSQSGGSFFFGGYHSENSSASSSYSDLSSATNASIQIGMNVAKVSIQREWFNPGIFYLTKDMYNTTNLRIAPNNDGNPFTDMNARLAAMNQQNIAFPCYPTAMVIARDITIKVSSESNLSTSFSNSVESHASSGGGFLFFSGSSSSSSSSKNSGAHAESYSNSVTVKFDTPQIIGYYLECIAPDMSELLDSTNMQDNVTGYVSVSEFIKTYKELITKQKEVE
ncbi:MAG: hypothetical protein LBM93_05940 [Oscillospiraceae bacterium]|nr:hypothetical protein [Oscillospiraceae bacterium]